MRWAYALGARLGWVLRPMLPLLMLAALYAAAALVLWLPIRRDPRATLMREQLLVPILNARPRPTWIPESEWRLLAQTGLALEGRSVFEPGLAAGLAEIYERSPWIERVGGVRLHYPALVSVERVCPRTPYALLESDGPPLTVDRHGFVLPVAAADMAAPATRRLSNGPRVEVPSIAGPRARRVERGQQVGQAEVMEGLQLLETVGDVLRRAPGALKVVRVQREPAGAWRVFTAGGPVIEWGYWDDERRPEGEPSAREKREWLARRLAEWDPRRLRYIRVDQLHAPVAPREG
jgi:hypothetical protein